MASERRKRPGQPELIRPFLSTASEEKAKNYESYPSRDRASPTLLGMVTCEQVGHHVHIGIAGMVQAREPEARLD